MRENLASVSFPNMAFTDCMKPTELAADKEIKRKTWRNRIRLLLKTNSSLLQRVKKRPYPLSVDDVNQWAQSFDKLLSDKYGKAAFCVFMRTEYCDENIDFWSACEEFKKIKSRKEMASKANCIYEEFVQIDALREVNLDFHTKNVIAQSIHKPTATIFLVAQRKIYNLMENNCYPRFISSDLYKELHAVAAREEMYAKS